MDGDVCAIAGFLGEKLTAPGPWPRFRFSFTKLVFSKSAAANNAAVTPNPQLDHVPAAQAAHIDNAAPASFNILQQFRKVGLRLGAGLATGQLAGRNRPKKKLVG